MRIICISGKAMSGKDTTAKYLKMALTSKGNKVLIMHFADLLKYVCSTYFGWNGEKDEKGRTLLQYVGTDVVRKQSPDFWANFVVAILSFFPNEWDYAIIPDCRFPSEYEIFKSYNMDAILLRVVRLNFDSPLTPEQQQHLSETALDNYRYDATIVNGGSMDDLKTAIADFVRNLKGEDHEASDDSV